MSSIAMRFFVSIVFVFFAQEVPADLYRWIDPESGSVKFSSYPPPWYGDPAQERRAPKVERIPERVSAPAAQPRNLQATELERLEGRRKTLLQQLSNLPARADFARAGSGLKQQLEAYQALSVELDRIDPKGAAARRAETQPLLDRLVEGIRAQLGAKPPAAPPIGR